MIRNVGAMRTMSPVRHMVNIMKAVSPAPLSADENIIARESNIDQSAINLNATKAVLFIDSNSIGSALAENG